MSLKEFIRFGWSKIFLTFIFLLIFPVYTLNWAATEEFWYSEWRVIVALIFSPSPYDIVATILNSFFILNIIGAYLISCLIITLYKKSAKGGK